MLAITDQHICGGKGREGEAGSALHLPLLDTEISSLWSSQRVLWAEGFWVKWRH